MVKDDRHRAIVRECTSADQNCQHVSTPKETPAMAFRGGNFRAIKSDATASIQSKSSRRRAWQHVAWHYAQNRQKFADDSPMEARRKGESRCCMITCRPLTHIARESHFGSSTAERTRHAGDISCWRLVPNGYGPLLLNSVSDSQPQRFSGCAIKFRLTRQRSRL